MHAELARELELVTVLADAKGRPLVEWVPDPDPYGRRAGAVILHDGKRADAYSLEETAADVGRLLLLRKLTQGTDKSESGYWLNCTSGGEVRSCACKGWTRYSHCKHARAVSLLVAGGLV